MTSDLNDSHLDLQASSEESASSLGKTEILI